jgi:hypothetical protein
MIGCGICDDWPRGLECGEALPPRTPLARLKMFRQAFKGRNNKPLISRLGPENDKLRAVLN